VSRQDAVRAALVRIGFHLGRVFPLRPEVVLATAHADRIGGNLAWIRDELRRAHPEITVNEVAQRLPAGLRAVIRAAAGQVAAGFRLATARLTVVDDYYFPMYVVPKRRGTTFVQVWHACGALKRFGYSLGDRSFGAGRRRGDVAIHSNYDLCLVSAARFAPFYAEAFGAPVERFTARLGVPRTDLFFDDARAARARTELRRHYAIPEDKRVVLYAPTFRGTSITRARSPNDLDLRALRTAVGEDHVVLLRAHPFVGSWAHGDPELDGFVIDVSDHGDVNELMLVSDILVTDYSSVIYEFALLGRPMAFFAPDHAEYEAERGFYVSYVDHVPGPVLTTTEGLADHLRSGQFDLARVRRFAAESFDVADGQATARFVEEVVVPAILGRLEP
jgi:CDP-ribitol ribitolphosphotransferase